MKKCTFGFLLFLFHISLIAGCAPETSSKKGLSFDDPINIAESKIYTGTLTGYEGRYFSTNLEAGDPITIDFIANPLRNTDHGDIKVYNSQGDLLYDFGDSTGKYSFFATKSDTYVIGLIPPGWNGGHYDYDPGGFEYEVSFIDIATYYIGADIYVLEETSDGQFIKPFTNTLVDCGSHSGYTMSNGGAYLNYYSHFPQQDLSCTVRPAGKTAQTKTITFAENNSNNSFIYIGVLPTNPPPVPPEVPAPPPDEVGASGDISFTLSWYHQGSSDPEGPDIDIWVIDPLEQKLSSSRAGFGMGPTPEGGEIDFDDRGASGDGDGGGPERVYWPLGASLPGEYSFGVRYYSGDGTANYALRVYKGETLLMTKTGSLASVGGEIFVGTVEN
ncbi:MAG: hypothetical protein C0619_04990 [Desulfuromonas sp.]|nr:MAG: hypothetical protein C0619_04990 [Desulfuromonas sp.]